MLSINMIIEIVISCESAGRITKRHKDRSTNYMNCKEKGKAMRTRVILFSL